MTYVYPILIFAAMGILFGVLLVVISKVFEVKTDSRVKEITSALPGANCGACGYAGCADYADAIVNKDAPMNACLPGGGNAATAIGDIMGVSVSAAEKQVPILHCNGTCTATKQRFHYDGIQTCEGAKRFYGGNGACSWGCLGYGDCASACQNDVISFVDGLPHFAIEKCVSCNQCISACPNNLIEMRPDTKRKVDVLCSSQDKGKIAIQACANSCIGCMKCEKACKFDAIHVVNVHAEIDYTKCKNCGLCVKECPRGCIQLVK